MNAFIAIALSALAGWFGWRAWNESRVLAAARRHLLDDASGLLGNVETAQLPTGYVKLSGTYRGLPAVIEPIVDTLNVRKLPVLWLMVTVPAPTTVRATFNLMMRASGLEVFSRYAQLDHAIDPPEGFPEWSGIRTDAPAALPPVEVVSRYLTRFHDGSGKELLISPKGVRMVVMVDQADRGGYLIFRDARFGAGRVSRELVQGVLDELHALRDDVIAQSTLEVVPK